MTPSAKRLLGLIKHRSQSESVYWVRLNLTEIGESLQLTRRTMMRAKAELIEMGLIRFRTISNGTGRGHKVHAALPERLRGLRGELLHSNRGRDRRSWTKIGGRRIERVTRRPRDTTYTKGTLTCSSYKTPPAPRGGFGQKPSQDFKSCAHHAAGEGGIRSLSTVRRTRTYKKRLIKSQLLYQLSRRKLDQRFCKPSVVRLPQRRFSKPLLSGGHHFDTVGSSFGPHNAIVVRCREGANRTHSQTASKSSSEQLTNSQLVTSFPARQSEQATHKRPLQHSPSKRQIRFAHWLKRDLWNRHWWENCKIQRSDAHLFGYALRSLLAGHDLNAISDCFERALKEMHGTATDVGLLTGDSHTVFSLSSTVSRATDYLRTHRKRAEGKEPDGIAKRSVGSCDDFDKKLPTAGFEPATAVRIEPATNHCQRARFKSIMDALA